MIGRGQLGGQNKKQPLRVHSAGGPQRLTLARVALRLRDRRATETRRNHLGRTKPAGVRPAFFEKALPGAVGNSCREITVQAVCPECDIALPFYRKSAAKQERLICDDRSYMSPRQTTETRKGQRQATLSLQGLRHYVYRRYASAELNADRHRPGRADHSPLG